MWAQESVLQKINFFMEEKTAFEHFLYGYGNEVVISDMEFCVDRIVMLPKIRPHQLEKAVRLSVEYCQNEDFHQKLLGKSNLCPVLIYRLYKGGIFTFDEIESCLKSEESYMISYYFRKEIEDFKSFIGSKVQPPGFDQSFVENEEYIDRLIDYGFLPSSIEYCMKYDAMDELVNFDNLNQEARWSPFEWSCRVQYLDLLSFSGFFGSIKSFKYLLMKGFKINNKVMSMVVCSGNLDLFHLSLEQLSLTTESICKASEFWQLPVLFYLVENGFDVNSKDELNDSPLHLASSYGHLSVVEYLVNQKSDINVKGENVDIFYIMRLLYIVLLFMVISMLLNISLIKKLR